MRQLPTQASLATVQLGERVYCSDVLFPMSVVGLANRRMKVNILVIILLQYTYIYIIAWHDLL